MIYSHFNVLPCLLEQKLITKRPHPLLPIDVYNYTPTAQYLPIEEWSEPLKDCRGLILDRNGEIVARPFRKFWNYEQVLAEIPCDEPFTVWEKLDGSLGIAANYGGEIVGFAHRVVGRLGIHVRLVASALRQDVDRHEHHSIVAGGAPLG